MKRGCPGSLPLKEAKYHGEIPGLHCKNMHNKVPFLRMWDTGILGAIEVYEKVICRLGKKWLLINIKQRGFPHILYFVICQITWQMTLFVERIKSICLLSHPWSRQEASLWHKLMPLFCLFELSLMLQEFTFLFNPLCPSKLIKWWQLHVEGQNNQLWMISLQYLSDTIFQTMKKTTCSITLYVLLWKIFHRSWRNIERGTHWGIHLFFLAVVSRLSGFSCTYKKYQVLNFHCYLVNPVMSAVH